jgi:GDP-L-fucose synthase
MIKYEKILITGGSGMVGRSLREIMPNAIYLSSKDCDLTNPIEIENLIKKNKPDIIVHLAAKVGGIIDNINKPAEYFDDNVIMNTLLLKTAYKYNVQKFIGILSTCIYPDTVNEYPMTEEMLHTGAPTHTNFSYGYAKRCLAVQIDAYNKQYGTKYQYITPCNLYGVYDKFDERSHFVAALIKKISEAKEKGDKHITLFGSGKPLRQFMNAKDLAKIIVDIIDKDISGNFNVSTTENISIDTISRIALKALDCEYMCIEYDSTKPDGQYRKDVDTSKFIELFPDFKFTSLEDGIREVYQKKFKDNE